MQWDIFCRVIDNFGDIGVCWRLCADLASRGHHVRLWVDDATALEWMAPGAVQGDWSGIQVLSWQRSLEAAFVSGLVPAHVWVEGFGCEIPAEFVQCFTPPVWINLEYLSAEPYVERCHGLPSSGTKHFFYPGFTRATGGLLRELDLAERKLSFDAKAQAAWLAKHSILKNQGQRLISLFCYEPLALDRLLQGLALDPQPSQMLVTHGRATMAVRNTLESQQALRSELINKGCSIHYLPRLTQFDYDHLLWACDVNFVRGEDSLVRAIWAGKPLVWQIYPQEDAAHHAKLDAFLRQIGASPEVRQLHAIWNGLQTLPTGATLPLPNMHHWQAQMHDCLEQLHQQPDLTSQLLEFVQIKSQSGIK